MNDILDHPDFYALCQSYRKAKDDIGEPATAEALESIKKWIREMHSFIRTPDEIRASQRDFT